MRTIGAYWQAIMLILGTIATLYLIGSTIVGTLL